MSGCELVEPRASTARVDSTAHLKHHAHVLAVRPDVLEVVVEAHAVLLIERVARRDLRQQRDLVARRVAVVRSTFLHLRAGSPSRLCGTASHHPFTAAR
jgi:hypothetical protein